MRNKTIQYALLLSLLCPLVSACATGLESFEEFVKNVKTGRAEFTQTVTYPPKDGQAQRKKVSTGSFAFARPNRFKFLYKKPFEQTIVADGQTLWLYDVDLNQVTARQQAAALGSTPAALIASATDFNSLQKDFVLGNAAPRDGLQWVLAVPKDKESSLQSVGLGFKEKDLTALEIVDNFGQKSLIVFNTFQLNPAFGAAEFQFKTPTGADVIRQ
jgi:outer membrane lipoprotein carrier protein